MNIVIIGSGNVAAVLGRQFRKAKHTILQIASRNAPESSALAYEFDTESTNYWSMINRNADIYIVAVSDDAIREVTSEMRLPGKIIAHTAASVSKDALKHVSKHYGVFYPLQSLRKEMTNDPEIPIYIDGSDEHTVKTLAELARSISSRSVQKGNKSLGNIHVAAVVVGNFTNYLYTLAEEYCRKEGLDFRSLHPLITETAQRIQSVSPSTVQTGPAVRHDQETIQKHLELLKEYPELEHVYKFLSECIASRSTN